jgi:hypothetical protein
VTSGNVNYVQRDENKLKLVRPADVPTAEDAPKVATGTR